MLAHKNGTPKSPNSGLTSSEKKRSIKLITKEKKIKVIIDWEKEFQKLHVKSLNQNWMP